MKITHLLNKTVSWVLIAVFSLGTLLPAGPLRAEQPNPRRAMGSIYQRNRPSPDGTHTASQKIYTRNTSIFGDALGDIFSDPRFFTPTVILVAEVAYQWFITRAGQDVGALKVKLGELRKLIRVLKSPSLPLFGKDPTRLAQHLRSSLGISGDVAEKVARFYAGDPTVAEIGEMHDGLVRMASALEKGMEEIRQGRLLIIEGMTVESAKEFAEEFKELSPDVRAAILSRGVPETSARPTRFLRNLVDRFNKKYPHLNTRPKWLVKLDNFVSSRKAPWKSSKYAKVFWSLPESIQELPLAQQGFALTLKGYTTFQQAATELIGTFAQPAEAASDGAVRVGQLVRPGPLSEALGGTRLVQLPHAPDLMKFFSQVAGREIIKEGEIARQVQMFLGQIAAAEARVLKLLRRAGEVKGISETIEAEELVRQARVLTELDESSQRVWAGYQFLSRVWNHKTTRGVRWLGKKAGSVAAKQKRAAGVVVGALLMYMTVRAFTQEDDAAAESLRMEEAERQDKQVAVELATIEYNRRLLTNALLFTVQKIWDEEYEESLNEAKVYAAEAKKNEVPPQDQKEEEQPTEDAGDAMPVEASFNYVLPVRLTPDMRDPQAEEVFNLASNRDLIEKVWKALITETDGKVFDLKKPGFLDHQAARRFWEFLWPLLETLNPKLLKVVAQSQFVLERGTNQQMVQCDLSGLVSSKKGTSLICWDSSDKSQRVTLVVQSKANLMKENAIECLDSENNKVTLRLDIEGKDLLIEKFAEKTPTVFEQALRDNEAVQAELKKKEEEIKRLTALLKKKEEEKKKATAAAVEVEEDDVVVPPTAVPRSEAEALPEVPEPASEPEEPGDKPHQD